MMRKKEWQEELIFVFTSSKESGDAPAEVVESQKYSRLRLERLRQKALDRFSESSFGKLLSRVEKTP